MSTKTVGMCNAPSSVFHRSEYKHEPYSIARKSNLLEEGDKMRIRVANETANSRSHLNYYLQRVAVRSQISSNFQEN